MNPNLNPLSNSGLELVYGQEVYFFINRDKRKKSYYSLFKNNSKEGQIVEIDELIKQTHKFTDHRKMYTE
ncbi:MAG TPA: hypothetical protein DEF82_01935 [Crocinitomicaceae bacterium]|nr:hypothetical protein [Flavobacteriales bacterium]HBW85530.1 hypothetical protein [Crocinitomicaceae bacterium]